ncbi:hypothetical protein D918_06085 [Trichuris suis]|nr:hypothetical protein D918_06085 [Trichuris suis]
MERDRLSWKSDRRLPTFPPVRLPSLDNSPTALSPESLIDPWILSPVDSEVSAPSERLTSRCSDDFSNSPEVSRGHWEQLELCRQQRYGSTSSSCFSMTSSMSSDNGESFSLVDDMSFGSDAYPPMDARRFKWEGRANVREFSRSDLLAINAETRLLEKRNAELKYEAEQLLHHGDNYVSKVEAKNQQTASHSRKM